MKVLRCQSKMIIVHHSSHFLLRVISQWFKFTWCMKIRRSETWIFSRCGRNFFPCSWAYYSTVYACVWCNIHKKTDGTKVRNQLLWWRTNEMHPRGVLILCHSKDNFRCICNPLLDIRLRNALLLLLQITDKLLQNVIDKVLERDAVENLLKPRG